MFKITNFTISTGPKPADLCDKYVKQRPNLTRNLLIVTFYQDCDSYSDKAPVESLVEGMLGDSV